MFFEDELEDLENDQRGIDREVGPPGDDDAE